MEELLEQLGNPQRAYPSVHIAGTKGKGSTTAMVEAILRASGLRTGMYTSPHLHTFRERIRSQGEPISEEDLVVLAEEMLPVLESRPQVSVFEAITALGMLYLARQQVDVGVFEVGLGGRLDATNVLTPLVSIITSISIDHVGVLGSTLEEIAREKAGIIKPNIPVVSAPQRPGALDVLRGVASGQHASLTVVDHDWYWRSLGPCDGGQRLAVYRRGHEARPEYPELDLPLMGRFQLENACTAVAAIEALRERGLGIADEAVRAGLAQVRWPGRLQVLSREPLIVVDGAHNAYSMSQLVQTLPECLPYDRLVLIFGAGRAHNPATILDEILPSVTRAYVTQAAHPKVESAEILFGVVQQAGVDTEICATPLEALGEAVRTARPGDLILATGSLFLVAEVMSAWAEMNGLPGYPCDPPGAY